MPDNKDLDQIIRNNLGFLTKKCDFKARFWKKKIGKFFGKTSGKLWNFLNVHVPHKDEHRGKWIPKN